MQFNKAYTTQKVKPKLDFSNEKSLTEQHHKDACDINRIITRYDRDGVLTHITNKTPQYINTINLPKSLQEAMNILTEANATFEALPSNIRKDFDNDVEKFLNFVHDPQNVDKMIEYGLVEPPQSPDSGHQAMPDGSDPGDKRSASEE